MTPIGADISDIGSDVFTFQGNYRAIVEDNADPIDIGRVRVRILGMHSLDDKETPVDHLPWAEPCLALNYSGGKNLDCKEDGSPKRYSPEGSTFSPPPRNTTSLTEDFVDTVMKKEGTGGYFGGVPRKGSMVWVFFENGDHTRPHYWAAAPKKDDWVSQKNKIVSDIKIKRDNVNYWRDEFQKILDSIEHKGTDIPTQNAKLKLINEKPKLEIFNIDDIENYHITSYTSPGGVTHIVVNKKGLEKHYIIHKGTIEYIEHNGQRKVMVGNNEFKNSGQKGTANDFEHLVGNNYELHIGGDFEVFVKKSKSVQIDGDCQVSVKKNVGIVCREGNVSIIVEKGDCNIDTKGKTNVHATDQIQIHANKDIFMKTDATLNIHAVKKTSVTCDDEIAFKAAKSISFEAGTEFNIKTGTSMNVTNATTTSFKCMQYSVTSKPGGFHVDGGSKFRIDAGGFGGDKTCNAQVVNARHPGCFPGPIAGFSAPYPGTPLSPAPPVPPTPLVFVTGAVTTLETPNPPAYTEVFSGQSLPPINTPPPSTFTFFDLEG
jgi:hypothetical protein